MRSNLIFGSFSLLYASIVSGAVVYDESVDGDSSVTQVGFPPVVTANPQLVLGAGQNILSGTQSRISGISDFDGFGLTVLPGFEITDITVTTNNGSGNGSFGWLLATPDVLNGPILMDTSLHTLGGIVVNTSFTSPLGEGDYFLRGNSVVVDPAGDTSLDYEWKISVTSTTVPVPAAAWFFGSALAGLGAARKSKFFS